MAKAITRTYKMMHIKEAYKMIGGNATFPDRREGASLQNPGEASLEAAFRGRWRPFGGSWRPLEAIRRPLEVIWRPLEAKIAYLTIIYYKTSHRRHKTSLNTYFCALGTPKSHDYPIIYMLYSTFEKRKKTYVFTCFCAMTENITIYTTFESPRTQSHELGPI